MLLCCDIVLLTHSVVSTAQEVYHGEEEECFLSILHNFDSMSKI